MTLDDIKDFQDYLLKEHDIIASLDICKKALTYYKTRDEQVEYVKKIGRPLIGYPNWLKRK